MNTTAEVTSQMAESLRAFVGLDLGDERACIRKLIEAGYPSGDITVCVDRAMAEARHRGLKLSGKIADAAGAFVMIAIWGALYCVVCPPGSF